MLFNPQWEVQQKTKTKTVRGVLIAAADWMELHGHNPDCAEDSFGRVCIVGAVINVSQRGSVRDAVFEKLHDELGWVTKYNKDHTGPQVVATLREIASRA